jgi:HD-GYP domain-containing protein (c-di-GMP phosphodiesterase class II)
MGGSDAQRSTIEAKFREKEYVLQDEGKTATVAVIGPSHPPMQGDFLPTTAKADYPLVWYSGAPKGEMLRRFFSAGAYSCLFQRNFKSFEELCEEIVRSAEDILALRTWMETCGISGKQGLGSVLLDELNVGISVLDRHFRIWYRNAKHKQMIPTKVDDCALCWIAYHDLTTRMTPCVPCPAADLFNKGEVLREPLYMAVGCGRKDPRDPRLTRVRAVPIRGGGPDGRVVGAVELVSDMMDEMFQPGERGRDLAIQGLLRTAFLQEYSRARLFIRTPDRQELVGHRSVVRDGVSDISCPIASLRLQVKPVHQTADGAGEDQKIPVAGITLPDEPQIRDVFQMNASEIEYYKELDKDKARMWADLPVRDPAGAVVGKVVVDRWSKVGDRRPQVILREDIGGYEHALSLLGKLISEAYESQAARDKENVAAGVEVLCAKSDGDESAFFQTLCSVVGSLYGVVSAIVRVPKPDKGDRCLVKIAGTGAYWRHCEESLAISQDTISGPAFLNRSPSKVLASAVQNTLRLTRPMEQITPDEDREELKNIHYQRSYPIVQPNAEPVGVLSVQCSDSQCLVDNSVSILVAVGSASLAVKRLQQFNDGLRECLLSVLELHDVDTAQHSMRVGKIAREVAKRIKGEDPDRAYLAGCLHDIGKVGLSTAIIREHTLLTAGEWTYARVHVELAKTILSEMPALQDICLAASEHHKWFDGTDGYPRPATEEERKQWGDRISSLCRIVAVADCYEAMTSRARVYKTPLTPTEALKAIVSASGTHFCPETVAAFRDAFGAIEMIP